MSGFAMGLRVVWALCLALIVSWSFYKAWRYEREVAREGAPREKTPGRETVVCVSPMLLPVLFVILAVLGLALAGPEWTAEQLLDFSLSLMVLLGVYFTLLLLLLPLLRRYFSARACAVLWVLPVFLYYNLYIWKSIWCPPLLVLRVPGGALRAFAAVWMVGAALVLGWRVCAHLVFRRRVMKRARAAQDPAVLALWRAEQERVERKRPIPLLVSPDVRSPMTVGVFSRTMRTLLPEREYSAGELAFIFRHELRHVQRRDVDTKLFCAFCQALCWFNPLVWIATRAASADLELSCDEMVLCGADETARRDYAGLLLDGAGDGRGFTTCLSASAQSLRYRLRNVVKPRKRFSGAALLGLVMAALVLCSGLVAVSGQSGTVGEVVFSRYGQVELRSLTSRRGDASEIGNYTSYTGDEADPAILARLAALPVTRIGMGERFLEEGERCLVVNLSSAQGWLWIDLSERFLEVDGPDGELVYMLDGPVDWDDLDACLGLKSMSK